MTGSEFPSLRTCGGRGDVMPCNLRLGCWCGGRSRAPGRVHEHVDVVAPLVSRAHPTWQRAHRGIRDRALQPLDDRLADGAVRAVEERLDGILDPGQSDVALQR